MHYFSCVMRRDKQYFLTSTTIFCVSALLFLQAVSYCLSLNFQSYFYIARVTEPKIMFHTEDVKLIILGAAVLISCIGYPASNVS